MEQRERADVLRSIRSRIARIREAAPAAQDLFGRLRRTPGERELGAQPPQPARPSADRTLLTPSSASSPEEPPAEALTARLTRLVWEDVAQDVQNAVAAAGAPDRATGSVRPAGASIRRLRIEGAAWRRGGVQAGSRVSDITLIDGDSEVSCDLQPLVSGEFNDYSRHPRQDRSGAGFVATVDAARLRLGGDPERVGQRRWTVRITVQDVHGTVSGNFSQRDEAGSPGQLHSCDIGAGCLAQAGWDKGLTIAVARRNVYAAQIGFHGTRLEALVRCRGAFAPQRAVLKRGENERELTVQPEGDGFRVSGSVADLADDPPNGPAARSWYLQVIDADGNHRHVHWQDSRPEQLTNRDAEQRDLGHRTVCPDDPRVAVRYAPNGVLRIDVHLRRLVADEVRIELDDEQAPALVISGECHGVPDAADHWRLVGGRHRVPATRVEVSEGRFTAVLPTVAVPEWGSSRRPLPSGDYQLLVDLPDGSEAAQQSVRLAPAFIQELPRTLRTEGNKIKIGRDRSDVLTLQISAPLADGERSRHDFRRFEIMHRTERIRPTETVLFDAFDGKAANDNTLAIHDELRRRRPDLTPLWTVADLSVELPPGAEPLVIKSEAWWRALTSSRYVVTNCWMPQRFRRRDHQTVLQAWHGTPLKLLGFDRIGTKRGEEYRQRTVREVEQWSMLISQNPHSSKVFRSAYGYQGRMLEIGYPRNDILSTADQDYCDGIRKRLGLRPDETVVLYVPTWRENAKGLFRELDFEAVARALGDHGRLLVRGHANTIRHSQGVTGPRVLDVTLYPNIADLYLVADAMITDYSSTMFDYSITGRPMIFFAPDIESYTGTLRGTYFDLAASAPGPILKTTDEVIDALGDLDRLGHDYAAAYRAWRQRFNPYDDGHASRRAVDALLGGTG